MPQICENDENNNKEVEIESNISPFIKKKSRGIYFREKLRAIELAKTFSNYKVAVIYKVNESTIFYWRK